MAKIRSVDELDGLIDHETVWRKVELSTSLKLIQQASGPAQVASIRAGVLVLYAHWEGWIKAISQLYVRYVNTQKFSYDSLSEAFLGNALKTKLTALADASAAHVHTDFASLIVNRLGERATVSENLVRTESNLSSKVLLDIVDRLGLEKHSEYTLRANLIDRELVGRRNSIAHGEFLELKPEEFRVLRTTILELLELFTDDVRKAASNGTHLRAPEVH